METITVRRTGRPPLKFEGEEIASTDDRVFAGKEQNRWHEVAVWKTAGERYVVQIVYRTQWQGEPEHHDATDETTLDGVREFLESYIPQLHVQGFPNTSEYAERQANLLSWVERRYHELVSDLCGELGISDRVE